MNIEYKLPEITTDKKATKASRTVIETILVVFLLFALLFALYEVMELFFGVLTFALIFAVSFNRFFDRITIWLKQRRKLSAVLYSVFLIAVIGIPLGLLISSLAKNVAPVVAWVNDVKVNGLPPLPASVHNMPLAGKEVEHLWDVYHDDPKQFINDHQEQFQTYLEKGLTGGKDVLSSVLNIIIGIIISAFLLYNKTSIVASIQSTFRHLVGEASSLSLIDAISMSIRGVSIGVMGTAFFAAILAFIGLMIAGIPFSLGLAAVVFFLVVIQLGPLPLWIPVILWMTTQNRPGMVVFLIIWGVVITVLDAVVKPILIGKSGGKLPFLVLFIGVIGGLAAWGFTGMFKGAIIVAIFYTVYNSWLDDKSIVMVSATEPVTSSAIEAVNGQK